MDVEWHKKRLRGQDDDYVNNSLQASSEVIAERLHETPKIKPSISLDNYLADYSLRLGDGSRKYEGLISGLSNIDELIGGLNKFILMAGIGGTGKSTLALQLGLGVMAHENVPMLYFSYEMGRDDIITMLLQNLSQHSAHKLFRKEIVLEGNSPSISSHAKTSLGEAYDRLSAISKQLYIFEGSEAPSLDDVENHIKQVLAATESTNCIVIIDSIQDTVEGGTGNQTAAEAACAQRIVEIQTSTGVTILAVSQKSKSGASTGGYSSILGSVALIHKPTTVIELTGVTELLPRIKDDNIRNAYKKLSQNSKFAQPVFMTVLKGRNNGYGVAALSYHGAHRYFTKDRVKDYDNGDFSLYSLMGVPEDKPDTPGVS